MLKRKILYFCLLLSISCILVYCSEGKQYKTPFGIRKAHAEFYPPNSSYLYPVGCKDGYEFLIIAVAEIKKGDKIGSAETEYVITDESGNNYGLISFGFPTSGSKEPFLMTGISFEGDKGHIEIGEDVDKTMLALLFLVPKKSQSFYVRKISDSKSNKLDLLEEYNPPDSLRISGYKMFGEVSYQYPPLDKNEQGWGLE